MGQVTFPSTRSSWGLLTRTGKTQFLVNQLCGPFCGKSGYVVLICPTFAYNRTLKCLAERDLRLFVIIPQREIGP